MDNFNKIADEWKESALSPKKKSDEADDEDDDEDPDEAGVGEGDTGEESTGATGATGETSAATGETDTYEEEGYSNRDEFSFTDCVSGLGMGFIGIIYILYGMKRNYTLLIVAGVMMMGVGYFVDAWQDMVLSAFGILVIAYFSGKRLFR